MTLVHNVLEVNLAYTCASPWNSAVLTSSRVARQAQTAEAAVTTVDVWIVELICDVPSITEWVTASSSSWRETPA